ncbi:MAG: acetate kinase [Lachnospiraceae bacterium]|nr:acetate kinase [Lachnospiraceae bacterium]
MNVLVINCGSSSLKFQVIDTESETLLAKGLCERIGIDGSISYENVARGLDKKTTATAIPNHKVAIELVLSAITAAEDGVVSSLDEIAAIGHRVVHGGERFTKPVLIDDDVIKGIAECADLAPLHNPANLTGIEACREVMPSTPMVAVFDTAFHQTMPSKAYMYAIPLKYYEDYKIRRYGFHGTSHAFVSAAAAEYLGRDISSLKIIVCHLGNGSSVSAVKNGKCVDTSMDLTPLEGLIMGTRSGDLDPAIVEYIANKEGSSASDVLNILQKKSGVFGLSGGISSDFRDLWKAKEEGSDSARLALEAFSYRVAKYIGAYAAAMNGVDVICFTAGVGENDGNVRADILSYLGYLGIEMDAEANKKRGAITDIATENSKVRVLVIPTNEELAIARETAALCG